VERAGSHVTVDARRGSFEIADTIKPSRRHRPMRAMGLDVGCSPATAAPLPTRGARGWIEHSWPRCCPIKKPPRFASWQTAGKACHVGDGINDRRVAQADLGIPWAPEPTIAIEPRITLMAAISMASHPIELSRRTMRIIRRTVWLCPITRRHPGGRAGLPPPAGIPAWPVELSSD